MEIPASGQEKRLTFRLLSYWQRIKAERAMPPLAEIRVDEITELWHMSFVINMSETPHRFQYFGPELATIFNADYTGETVDFSFEDSIFGNVIGFYPKVMETQQPIAESDSFMVNGKDIRYRSLIVPLSSDGKTVDYVLGTANYREF